MALTAQSPATHHIPVVYRAHTRDELRALGARDVLKVAELSRRSSRVICLAILPIISDAQQESHPFWTTLSALPMCQAEINALSINLEDGAQYKAIEFTLGRAFRLLPEWRREAESDRRDCQEIMQDERLLAELSSVVGQPVDAQSISPQLRSRFAMILWLVFHPVGPSAVELTSLPYEEDVFDYDAFGSVPRAFCALCARKIPMLVIHTPCAFHPGVFDFDLTPWPQVDCA